MSYDSKEYYIGYIVGGVIVILLKLAFLVWYCTVAKRRQRVLALQFLSTYLLFNFVLANRGPVLPGKNLMRLSHPSGHFCKAKFLSCDLFKFWSWVIFWLSWGRFDRVRRSGWQRNHPWISVEVWTKFGGDWFGNSRVKEGHRYKQSVLYM